MSRVRHHISGKLSVLDVVSRIGRHAAASSTSVVNELLDIADRLGNCPPAPVGILVEDAEGRISDRDRGLDAGDVLTVRELLALVHTSELALGFAEKAFVTRAETAAPAVDSEGRRSSH